MAERTKSGQFQKKIQQDAFAAAQALTKEGVLDSVAKIRSSLDNQVAKIAESVQEKITELETVTAAVEFQKGEAERIHGVEAIARSVEEADQEFEQRKSDLGRQELEFRKNYELRLVQARADNDQAISNLESDRKRSEATWQYTFEQTKKAANDQLNEDIRVRKQAEKVRIEDQERNWLLREQGVKSQEQEIVDLRAKVANFPIELDAEVKKQTAIVGSSMKRDKEHEIALLNSSNTAQRTVDANTIQNLTTKLADKDAIIGQLQVQLAAANKAQEAIATKALETASNVKALADLQTTNAINSNGQKRA